MAFARYLRSNPLLAKWEPFEGIGNCIFGGTIARHENKLSEYGGRSKVAKREGKDGRLASKRCAGETASTRARKTQGRIGSDERCVYSGPIKAQESGWFS